MKKMRHEKQAGPGQFDQLHTAVNAAAKRVREAERELKAAHAAERGAVTDFLCFIDQAGRDVAQQQWRAALTALVAERHPDFANGDGHE